MLPSSSSPYRALSLSGLAMMMIMAVMLVSQTVEATTRSEEAINPSGDDRMVVDNPSASSMLVTSAITILVILLSVFVISTYKVYKSYLKVKDIPGCWQYFFSPVKIPFFAPYFYMGNTEETIKLVKQFGDKETKIVRISMVDRNTIFIVHPDMLKEYFLTKANTFEKPEFVYQMFNVYGENILSALNTESWKKHFRVCSPAFSSKNLEYMCKVATQSSELLFQRWDKGIKENKPFILPLGNFSDVTLDILGKAAFGVDFGVFSTDAEGTKLREAMENVINYGVIVRRFVGDKSIFYPLINKILGLDKAIKFCGDKLDEIIKQRKEIIKKDGIDNVTQDILSLLVEANMLEKLLTDDELKSNAFIMSLAGHETTSTLLGWTLYELSKRPEIANKLYHEITQAIGSRDPTYDDYGILSHVNSVIMESLRLHPPVLSVVKSVAKKNTTIGKYNIPKGTIVLGWIDAIHHDEDVFKNPEEFIPERFDNPEFKEKVQHDMTWIPFSMGNRKCIGYRFALLEGCMILTKMVQKYKFKLLNDETVDPVKPKPGVTIRPSTNLKIQVIKRE